MFTKRLLSVVGIAVVLLAACAPATLNPTPSGGESLATATPLGQDIVAPQPSTGKQWDQPPAMTIDTRTIYIATLKTAKGDIRIQLFADQAPKTVNNFIFLAREGFYDGTTFHRVLENFMAQGGDPTGTGSGGPGYQFEDEIAPDLQFDGEGYLAMANSGPGTNGSQFFITTAATTWLNGAHTIFGKVISGMEVVRALTLRDPDQNPGFPGDALTTITIEEAAASLLPTPVPIKVPVMEAGRPLAQVDYTERASLYGGKPEMEIDTARTYTATITTTKGEIVIALSPADAPESANNFILLANLGYWDDFPINFVEPSGQFVLTGSPAGQPDSDVGYTLAAEPAREAVTGAVGYYPHYSGVGNSASQFFILLQDTPNMTGQFTFFGNVVEGLDVARQLTTDDRIETITIEGSS